ncbi:hypothetical protein [Cysteiniphilum halobium]|uniref:hypothetical protein n=1 Tax=Cysteiniphilum halobium TaxID=2219059 RepID=UPI003F87A4D1
MNHKVTLSIAISSLLSIPLVNSSNANTSQDTNTSQVKQENAIAANTGGKCAAGKCGTEKLYAQAKLAHNPQDKLIYARDGKCGTTGYGIKPSQTTLDAQSRSVGGICGQ